MITADLSAGLRVRACDCNSFRNQFSFSLSSFLEVHKLTWRAPSLSVWLTHTHTHGNIIYSLLRYIQAGQKPSGRSIKRTHTQTRTHALFSRNVCGREGWQGCRILQTTWDRGASHHHLSTVMSLIIYISFRIAHFPKRYPSLNLWRVTATTLFSSFLNQTLVMFESLIACYCAFLYLTQVFKVKAMREQIFKKMLNLSGFRDKKCAQHVDALV